MQFLKLCPACEALFKEAYELRPIHEKYVPGKSSVASCENCGKRMVLLDTYEVTMKKRPGNV